MKSSERSNIILSIAGMSVSRLGSFIYTFAIGLFVLNLTGSGQSFAVTLMLGILPRVLLGPIAGNLADRMNKKALIVGSDVFSGMLMALLFAYALKGDLTLLIIYGTTFLLSISSVLLDTAFGAAQRDIVKLESLTSLGSIRQSVESIINLAAPMIGGLIYAVLPIGAFLLINGISFFISAFSELFIDFNFNKSTKQEKVKQSFINDMKSGFAYFRKDKLLLGIGFSALMLNFFLSSTSVILPFAIVQQMEIEENLFGLSTSIISLGALGGAIIVGKRNSKLTRSYFLKSAFSIGVSFSLIGISMHTLFGGAYGSLILITLFGFMTIAFATFINVPISVFLQTRVDPSYLGRVSSIIGSLVLAVMPFAYIFYGILTEYFSPFYILTISGALFLLMVLIMFRNPVFHGLDLHVEKMSQMEEEPA